MMENEMNREKAGTLPLEDGAPERAPVHREESSAPAVTGPSGEAYGTRESPEREAAAREEYWNSVLTGDVMTIPLEVRRKAEACIRRERLTGSGGRMRDAVLGGGFRGDSP